MGSGKKKAKGKVKTKPEVKKAKTKPEAKTKPKAKTEAKTKPEVKTKPKAKTSKGKAPGGKRTNAAGSGKKRQNPNLRLVKNGDLPVGKKEIPVRKTEIPKTEIPKAEIPKKGASQKGIPKVEIPKKGTSQKGIPKKESRREAYPFWGYGTSGDREYAKKRGAGDWFLQHRSLFLIGLTVFLAVAALAAAYHYVLTNYRVTTVYVDGNIHYSNEEIMEMVMDGVYGNNSLYLALKYREKGVEGVPFVEKMDVTILAPNTIRISVYEKALAGYVEYLGRYMYFDRNGTVVESSGERTVGIPQVTGLQFGYVILNEPLPVENDAIFKRILSITQLLDKYELTADKIYFDKDYNLTLYFGEVRATMGPSEEIDEKVMRLQYILPELAGKKGMLQMENYTEDTKSIPFIRD